MDHISRGNVELSKSLWNPFKKFKDTLILYILIVNQSKFYSWEIIDFFSNIIILVQTLLKIKNFFAFILNCSNLDGPCNNLDTINHPKSERVRNSSPQCSSSTNLSGNFIWLQARFGHVKWWRHWEAGRRFEPRLIEIQQLRSRD